MKIPKSWTFKDNQVAKKFDSHVREQLPWYNILTNLVAIVAKHYMPENGIGYDIGASTGNLGNVLKDIIKSRRFNWIGIDNSEQMKAYYRAPGKLEICDAIGYDFQSFDIAVCFLVLMFFPKDKRELWLKNLIEKAKFGAAIIIVDKEELKGGILSTALYRATVLSKLEYTTAEKILEKESSLCGIQNPLPRDFMLQFGATEIFRFGDFAAWVIEKKWH